MSQSLMHIGQTLVGFMIVTGPVIILLLILKARDRRESTLRFIILKQLRSPNLRGLYTFRIRHGVLLGGNTIVVNLWDIPREQVWDTTMHLALSLPPKVRLVVNGTMDQKHKVSFALKVKREAFAVHPAFCCS
jgi:hypothetical protein